MKKSEKTLIGVPTKKLNVKEEIKRLKFKVVFVPHKIIKDHNACYNVNYKGKLIRPFAAKKLGIPLNEIWVSEKFRKYDNFILYHELQEIKYRWRGHDRKIAHLLAQRDEVLLWKNNPKWKKMNTEMGVGRERLIRGCLG